MKNLLNENLVNSIDLHDGDFNKIVGGSGVTEHGLRVQDNRKALVPTKTYDVNDGISDICRDFTLSKASYNYGDHANFQSTPKSKKFKFKNCK